MQLLRSLFRFSLCVFYLLLLNFNVQAAPLSLNSIPENLKPWLPWVLHEHQNWQCPHLYNSEQKLCVWPSLLAIEINQHQAKFRQTVSLDADHWLVLAGDMQYWAQQVTVRDLRLEKDTASPAVVVSKNQRPAIWLPAGDYEIQGQWTWEKRPEFLQIPSDIALVRLHLDGQSLIQPKVDKQGRLWLRQGKQTQTNEADRLALRVYRHILDDMPLQLTTRLELEVAGQAREITLDPLWKTSESDQWSALSMNSALPAKLDADGRLQIQVRPGSWLITVTARHLGIANQIQPALLNDEEIWVFQAQHALRQVDIEGAIAIDPQQTGLPTQWKQWPAYQILPNTTLKFIETRRGNPEPAPNQLKLHRDIWLDFDGQGYTLKDTITGTMSHDWRLNMNSPIQLGRVNVDAQDRFITRLNDKDKRQGVEVRQGKINLRAESRINAPLRALPALGWAHDFQSLSTRLHLPPGWRLWHAKGVDNIPNTWLHQWTLFDLFIVLITALAIGKLWSWQWGALALLTLGMIYHEADAPQTLWLNALSAIALFRVLPAGRWFTRTVRLYRDVTLLVLLIVTLLFMAQQMRQSLYPQLEHQYKGIDNLSAAHQDNMSDMQQIEQAEMPVMAAAPNKQSRRDQSYQYMKSKPFKTKKWRKKQFLQVDPQAQVQTGPGLPAWRWSNVYLSWNGPVQQQQIIHLQLMPPWLIRTLHVLSALLAGSLMGFLLWKSVGQSKKQPPKKSPQNTVSSQGTVLSLMLMTLLFLPLLSQAQETAYFPDTALLKTLEERLLKPPECLPDCASLSRLHLQANATGLNLQLDIHAQSQVAIPLPGQAKQWLPQQVIVDDKQDPILRRGQKGHLWLQLSPGVHRIHLQGILPKQHSVQLALPLAPRYVTFELEGWHLDGVHENGISDAQLQLTREKKRSEKTDNNGLEMASLPPLVQVERTLLLNLDWQVETHVRRLSPKGSAVVLSIPLLKGESITSSTPRMEKGHALINMSPNQTEVSWISVFDQQTDITLTANDSHDWFETWKVDSSAIWHLELQGIPVIHHQNKTGAWLPTWRPWQGESVQLSISRPLGVAGQSKTIDGSQLTIKPGQRVTETTLSFNLRSSRGGQHIIELPEQAQLQSLSIDQQTQPIRQENRQVTLPLHPGAQHISLRFIQPLGISSYFTTPSVNLGVASVNSQIHLDLPKNRWILFLGGPQLGPAVLFWGLLFVLLIISIILGRNQWTPLRTWQWFLLGLVVSQLHITASLFIFAWLLTLGWRGQLAKTQLTPKYFDLLQIALVFFSLIALSILLAAIEHGLLRYPEMHIAGNNSYATYLRWYQDRALADLPQAWVISIPLWLYRVAMLLWALWLAFALLHWLHWGWQCFSRHALWIPLRTATKKSAKNTLANKT